MDRREKVLERVNPASQVGIEIGPLDRPIILREEGAVYYVDHVSTEDLLAKYKHDPAVKDEQVVDVDFTWGSESLSDLLGDLAPVDYIVASHVIEHVPDVIGWLAEAAAALATGGTLELIVPDRRFTFDYERDVSTSAELIGAYLSRLRRPSPGQVFAHFSQVVELDVVDAWTAVVPTSDLKHHHTIDEALDFATRAADGEYVDAHCWVFTPESFVIRLGELVNVGLLDFSLVELTPTPRDDLEFHVSLQKLAPDMDEEGKRQVQREGLTVAARHIAEADAPDAGRQLEAEALSEALQQRELRLQMIASSTSWRVTAPLRFLGRALSRFRK